MQTTSSHRYFVTATGCLSLLLGAMLSLSQAHGAVIASDDFTAANGTLIQGRVTPVGGLTWTDYQLEPTLYLGIENGGVTSLTGAVNYDYMSVPFSVGSNTSFEIDINLKPYGNNMNLTFATTSTAAQGSAQMTLWGAINGGGGWGLYQGGTALASGGGLTAGSTSYGDAFLKYDVTTSTLTFNVGGNQLYSGVVTSFNPADITTAGVSFAQQYENDPQPQLNSFSLIAVPEPQTWALAGLGGLALVMRRRFRRRMLPA